MWMILLHLHINLNTDDNDDDDDDDDDDDILSSEAVIHDVLEDNIFCMDASKDNGEILRPITPYFCLFQKIMSVIK